MPTDIRTCSKCDSRMKLVLRTTEVPVAGVTFSVTWRVWECPKDGNFAAPVEVHQEFDRSVVRELAERGPATGRTLKHLRGSMKMKAGELAALLNVQPETLSRWENEAQPVNPLAWVTVARMALDRLDGRHTTADQLKAAVTGDKPLAPIEVRVA